MKENFEFFKEFYKKHLYSVCAYVVFCILHKASIVLIPLFTQKLVDTATAGNDKHQLQMYGFRFLLIIICFIVFLSLKYYFQNNIEVSILNDIKLSILEKINRISFNELISKDSGYFIQRINNDNDKIRNLVVESYTMLIINIIYVFSIIVVMVKLNLLLTAGLLTLLPIFVIISKCFLPRISKINEKILKKNEIVNTYVEETINGNYTLRVHNSLKYMESKMSKVLRDYFKLQLTEVKYEIIYDFILVTGIMNMATLLTYWLGGYLVFREVFSVGTLIAFTLYFNRLWDPIEFFMNFPKKAKVSKVSLHRIGELLFSQENIDGDIVTLDSFNSLTLQNVSFAYKERKLFDKLNLVINRGEKIAIIGANGIGKSTFANFLVKMNEPSSGNIYYNDINYKNISSFAIRNKIALIPSDVYLFQASLIENITLEDSKEPNMKLINEIGLEQIFKKNNKNFDTIIDNKGQNLSGGEKKLVQIARGISKNADIYILDEPLNYVDNQYKKIIINFIYNNFKDKTLIIISHNPEILDICDTVYCFDSGKLMKRHQR